MALLHLICLTRLRHMCLLGSHRSSDSNFFIVLEVRTERHWEGAFVNYTPKLWNSQPGGLKGSKSVDTFKQNKTLTKAKDIFYDCFLFKCSYLMVVLSCLILLFNSNLFFCVFIIISVMIICNNAEIWCAAFMFHEKIIWVKQCFVSTITFLNYQFLCSQKHICRIREERQWESDKDVVLP